MPYSGGGLKCTGIGLAHVFCSTTNRYSRGKYSINVDSATPRLLSFLFAALPLNARPIIATLSRRSIARHSSHMAGSRSRQGTARGMVASVARKARGKLIKGQ
jgi:hypothetical protein